MINEVAKRLQEIIFEVVSEPGWKLIALEIMPDHVHLFVNAPTHESPSHPSFVILGYEPDFS